MPREKSIYECNHDKFPSCSFSSGNKATVQYHERRHEIVTLIDRLSEVHDHKHNVQQTVVEFLADWLEHGMMAGTVECTHCGESVHATLDQCPECHRPVHELQDGALLRCGECDSHAIKVMQKDGQRRKQGYRCADCGAYVAHGNGILSFHSNTDDGFDMGYWSDA